MPDHATSAAPAVQHQLDRLWALSPGTDILGLERITKLLARLGNPHLSLPPVLHIAGTNGKGSTCAFLRAAIEAAGMTCHVYSSPHLVRFNERIRLAGTLIDDDALAALLEEVLDHAGDLGASFFEVTTAAAFLAFARTQADACVIEVGLGGRLDATNVVRPIVTGIAQLGIDHQAFLGHTAEDIAAEKAGIAKPGVPLVTMRYPPSVADRIATVADAIGAPVAALGSAWRFEVDGDRLHYADVHGTLDTPVPRLPGPHQPGNLALAIAMLRHQRAFKLAPSAIAAAADRTIWPARMQRLAPGPLTALLPAGSELWLDGGHNAGAAEAISTALHERANGRPIALVLGMLANKDPAGLLGPFAAIAAELVAVPTPGHDHHAPIELARIAERLGIAATYTAPDLAGALSMIAKRHDPGRASPVVLILGSLYLAGQALRENDEIPT